MRAAGPACPAESSLKSREGIRPAAGSGWTSDWLSPAPPAHGKSKYIKEIGSREGGSAQRVLIRIRIQHFRSMRIRIQSGSRSGSSVLMIKSWKKIQTFFCVQNCNFAHLGTSQLQGEASSLQKRTSSSSNREIAHFSILWVSLFLFSWIRIQPTKSHAHPCARRCRQIF